MSQEEIAVAQTCYERGQKPSGIAAMLGRDKSVLTRLLCKQEPRRKQGRPALLPGPAVDLLQRRLHELIVQANGQKTVTVAHLKKAAKCRASPKIMLQALHKRNIYFRKLREKPVLTPEDIRARLAFARAYRDKSAAWWLKNVHAFIDGKHFQVYLNSAAVSSCPARNLWCIQAAWKRLVRGLCETKGRQPAAQHWCKGRLTPFRNWCWKSRDCS